MVIAQYTFLSGIHPGNRNWIEIFGVVLVVISSTVPAYMRAKHKQEEDKEQGQDENDISQQSQIEGEDRQQGKDESIKSDESPNEGDIYYIEVTKL